MCKVVNLKIQIDVLRKALDEEILYGDSIILVREIHKSLKESENVFMASWAEVRHTLLN